MEQKTELQIAQELKEKRDKIIINYKNKIIDDATYFAEMTVIDEQAKSNLEGLGCGKEYQETKCGDEACFPICVNRTFTYFCPDCLAKGVDKAKAIYEGILK